MPTMYLQPVVNSEGRGKLEAAFSALARGYTMSTLPFA